MEVIRRGGPLYHRYLPFSYVLESSNLQYNVIFTLFKEVERDLIGTVLRTDFSYLGSETMFANLGHFSPLSIKASR